MSQILMRSVSVDCVVFGFDVDELKVLLVERTLKQEDSDNIIFTDQTLAGFHIYEHEELDEAAARIVYDLTGWENLNLAQFYSFGGLKRLESKNDQLWMEQFGDAFNNRIVSIGYYSLLPTVHVKLIQNNRNVDWYPVYKLPTLGYDHKDIIQKALEHLRDKLRNEPVGFDLLPTKFTLSQMQKLYEAIFEVEFDKRNFRKKVGQMKYIVALDEKQTGVAHKPAQLFMFSRDVYEKTKKERVGFFV